MVDFPLNCHVRNFAGVYGFFRGMGSFSVPSVVSVGYVYYTSSVQHPLAAGGERKCADSNHFPHGSGVLGGHSVPE